MRLKTTVVFSIFLSLFFLSGSMSVASAQDDVTQLKQQIEMLQKRIEELESKQAPARPHSPVFDQDRWDPFAEMERMQRDMDRLFSGVFGGSSSPRRGMFTTDMVFDHALDLKETDEGYEIRFDMTGLNKEKMDIQINPNSITVSGQYSEEHRDEAPESFIHSQRFGTFLRPIPLPVDADTSRVKTEQKGEELVITMPKKK